MKVAKFGGTSLANAAQVKKVIDIIQDDSDRQFIVVSAPGKRHPGDRKVTDLLQEWHHLEQVGFSSQEVQSLIFDRFLEIEKGLGVDIQLQEHFKKISEKIKKGGSLHYALSRGEYLMALILAAALEAIFEDAAHVIYFHENQTIDLKKTRRQGGLRLRQWPNRVVIPGFYGSLPDKSIFTFPRGGSDVSGAIIAEITGAEAYENWTDVSGFFMANPTIVRNAPRVPSMNYDELRELSYMGASVLHCATVLYVKEARIPIVIKNTNAPKESGTFILPEDLVPRHKPGSIVAISDKGNFSLITVQKTLMHEEVGFAVQALNVLLRYGISFEHIPSSIDTLSLVISNEQLGDRAGQIMDELQTILKPDKIDYDSGLALICVVGSSMAQAPGVAAKIFRAIAKAKVNVRTINQGSSEISIIIGVAEKDRERTVKALYRTFRPSKK